MKSVLDLNRSRLINLYLAGLVQKTGNMIAAVKLPDGSITTVQLDSDIVEKALKKLFESSVIKVTPPEAAEREISETYSECVKLKSGKLSDMGNGFMDALISNLTELAFAERGNK